MTEEASQRHLSRLKSVALALLMILLFILLPCVPFVLAVWYHEGGEGAYFITKAIAILMGVGSIMGLFMVPIERATEDGKGKSFKVVEVMDVLCKIFLSFIGLYVVAAGVNQLWRQSWEISLMSAGALAFVIYYWMMRKQ